MENHSVIIVTSSDSFIMRISRVFVAFALIAISCTTTVKAQATASDWEVLSQAINAPNSVSIPVLQESILRILRSFVPPLPQRP